MNTNRVSVTFKVEEYYTQKEPLNYNLYAFSYFIKILFIVYIHFLLFLYLFC